MDDDDLVLMESPIGSIQDNSSTSAVIVPPMSTPLKPNHVEYMNGHVEYMIRICHYCCFLRNCHVTFLYTLSLLMQDTKCIHNWKWVGVSTAFLNEMKGTKVPNLATVSKLFINPMPA